MTTAGSHVDPASQPGQVKYASSSDMYLQLLVISRNGLHNCCISLVWRERYVPDLGNTIPSKHEARLQKAFLVISTMTNSILVCAAWKRLHLGCTAVIVCKMPPERVKDVTVINMYNIMLDMPTDTKATPASKEMHVSKQADAQNMVADSGAYSAFNARTGAALSASSGTGSI